MYNGLEVLEVGKFDSPIYDEPRRWIQKKYESGNLWDNIKNACKSTETELTGFLTSRVSEDNWPVISIEEWRALVTECEEIAGKQQELRFRGNDGALFSVSQDNALKIPENERSSWQLYKNSLGWNPDSIQDLEDATIGILRRLSTNTRETGPIKGLVIGHVQSGKTANMEALMAMAADHGWNMFIVLSGSIEALRLQTLKRMQKDLNQEGNLIWRGVEHPSKKSQYGERLQDLHFEPGSQSRYFTVCLKNASRLKKLLDWIHADRGSHDQMRILVIDDEADQASISNTAVEYNKAKKERKGINKLIVNLVQDEHYKPGQTNGHALAMNYVMYTATPYANFLNESTPDSLYPSHFIWTLKTSKEYIGPNQIFGFSDPGKTDGLDIKCTITKEDLDRIEDMYEGDSNLLPTTLMDAICWFMCATAVMRFWGYKKPISMLVHTSQKQRCHEIIAQSILKWVNDNLDSPSLLIRCATIYTRETARIAKDVWLDEIEDYGVPADEIKDYPSFEEIEDQLKLLFSEKMQHITMTDTGDLKYQTGLHLVIDNCAKNGVTADNEHIRLAYPDPDTQPYPSPAPAFIVVGGSTLSRGLTIEGLVSTFFLRASCQADTLMQMGRWFGYRRNYELLPRIWMTSDTMDKFRFLSELELDLREDLKKYMIQDVMPSEYGPRILCSPKVSWLKLTSKNHQRNATPAEMDFSGAKPQTVIFNRDVAVQQKNIEVTEAFLVSLGTHTSLNADKTALCWKNVPLDAVMNFLLHSGFTFSLRSRTFNEIGVFCEWIQQVAKDNVLDKWSVIVAGNSTVQKGTSADEKHWVVDKCIVGKVNRSRRTPTDESDKSIDIGALRALKDLVADVPEEYIPQGETLRFSSQVDEIRKAAGVDKIPVLIIYRIDGKSKKRERASSDRQDMDMPCDIIGLQVCVPGDQINSKYVRRLTIQLPEKDREEQVEDIIHED